MHSNIGRSPVQSLTVSFLFAVCLMASGPSSASTALTGTLDEIKSSGEMKIAYRTDTPPFSSKAPDATEPEGFTIDMCRIIAADIAALLEIENMQTTWVPTTAEDRIDSIAQGRAHLECGATTITLSRQEHVDFSNLTYATGASLMRLRKTDIEDIYDLGGKKVAVVRGTTTASVLRSTLQEAGIDAKVVEVRNHAQALQMLIDRKVAAMAGDQATLFGIGFKAKAEQELVITADMLSFEPFGLPLRRNDADFRLAVNRSLSNLYMRGDVGRSWEVWFGQHGVRPSQLLLMLYRLNSFTE